MGTTAASESCHAVAEKCPALNIAADSELQRRQKAHEERKKRLGVQRAREPAVGPGTTTTINLGGVLDDASSPFDRLHKFSAAAGKFLQGEASLAEVLAAGSQDQADTKDQEEAVDAMQARLNQFAQNLPDEDLQQAAMRGELKKVNRALDMQADPSKHNVRGITPLMMAASSSGREAMEVLKEMYERNVDLNVTDNHGWNAMHHACRNGKTEAVRYLIQMSGEIMKKTNDDKTVLILATMEGKVDLLKDLIKDRGVEKTVTDKDSLGASALHYAMKNGSLEVAKILIEHNARVNAKDVDAMTPLMWACEHGRLDCVKLLIRKAADPSAKDKSHRTPVLHACLSSYEAVAVWLVNKSADPFATDMSGDSAISIAEDLGLSELKKLVKQLRLQLDEDDG